MKKHPIIPTLLLLSLALVCCQQNTEEDKSLASTHPKLEKQLSRHEVATPVTSEENPQLFDQYRITLQEYEHSGDYAVLDMYRGRLAPLDEQSHADARTYRTALREGLKAGVNFAGQYTIVTVGCGTGCQTHYVVDRQNGKVLDKVQSTMGAKYSANSRLLIVNPPVSTVDYSQCHDCAPKVYSFEHGKLRQVEHP